MASVEKYCHHEVAAQLNHNLRSIDFPSNTDIDFSLTDEKNYSLHPLRGVSDYDYYLARKDELYCYNRSDVKTAAGWVITVPKDFPEECYREFFETSYNFLCEKYGERNILQSIVHGDELGETPHMHTLFIPVVDDRKHGGEKICCNDVLNPKNLRNWHPEYAKYLKEHGVDANVHTGITRELGGNRTVRELKAERDKERYVTHERSRWG